MYVGGWFDSAMFREGEIDLGDDGDDGDFVVEDGGCNPLMATARCGILLLNGKITHQDCNFEYAKPISDRFSRAFGTERKEVLGAESP
jgi:hypothetical protein